MEGVWLVRCAQVTVNLREGKNSNIYLWCVPYTHASALTPLHRTKHYQIYDVKYVLKADTHYPNDENVPILREVRLLSFGIVCQAWCRA